MKTCSKSPGILLKVIYIILLPATFEAQKIRVWPEVTGYVGYDVTLPCQFIPGPEGANVTQFQWDLKPPQGKEISIIVSNDQLGVNVHDTFLKERVDTAEQSLIIRSVELRDAGMYTCVISAFPSGSFEGTTILVVKEQMPLSSGVVSAIVIAVMLLFVIIAAIVYLFIRRRDTTVRQSVYIDTGGPVMDVTRPSVIVRDQDVVYSTVKLKPSTATTSSSNKKHTAEDVTYSEVLVLHPSPKESIML